MCVATAANQHLLAVGWGVARRTRLPGSPIQIIDYGSVNAAMVGTGPVRQLRRLGNLALSL